MQMSKEKREPDLTGENFDGLVCILANLLLN